jgi:hypothetical protein
VITGKQERPLRDTDIGADLDLNKVVDPYPFAYPDMISDYQPPRMLDSHPGLNDYAVAYLCAKQSKE